jgi:hypothetical protein
MTYGSEIWISEFKINFNVIDKLLNIQVQFVWQGWLPYCEQLKYS